MNDATQKKLLLTRPEHDPGTRYLSRWAQKVIDAAHAKGWSVVDLRRDRAVRSELEGRLAKVSPSLVMLNGHGALDRVTGHDNETLVAQGDNEAVLRGRVTYAVSCSAGGGLGPACADGDTAFIGYDDVFVMNVNRQHLNSPDRDSRAARYLEPSNHVPLALLKGHTAAEASRKSRDAFRKQIRDLLLSGTSDPDDLADVKDLYWDMTHQVCCGNGGKRV